MKTTILHRFFLVALTAAWSAFSQSSPERIDSSPAADSVPEKTDAAPLSVDTPSADDEKSEEPSAEQRVEAINKRLSEIKQMVDSVKTDTQTILLDRYKRNESRVQERVKAALKAKGELDAATQEREAATGVAFEYDVITRADTEDFVKKGDALIKKALSALGAKGEGDQVRGLELYAQISENYRGAVKYDNVKKKAKVVMEKFSKKWNRSRENLERVRQKAQPATLKKWEANEKRQYDRLSDELSAAGKEIKGTWFLPQLDNMLMLNDACNTARTALATMEKEDTEEGGRTEEVLNRYWDLLDHARQKMMEGEYDEGSKMLSENEVVSDLRSLRGNSISMDMRTSLTSQLQKLRSELQNRNNNDRKIAQKISRAELSQKLSLNAAEDLVRGMEDDFARIKEDEQRRSAATNAREKGKNKADAAREVSMKRRKGADDDDSSSDEKEETSTEDEDETDNEDAKDEKIRGDEQDREEEPVEGDDEEETSEGE